MPEQQTLASVLASVSDVMFPHLDNAPVEVNSRDCSGDTPLHVMAVRGNNVGAELLIEAGAEVNAIGDMGETPLHVALSRRNEELVRFLVHSGADVDIRSEFNRTPREMAERMGAEFVEWLRLEADTTR